MKKLFVTVSRSTGSLVLDTYDGKNGCYVCAIPDESSKKTLAGLARQIGNIDHAKLREKLHTTIMYSKRAPKALPKFNNTVAYAGICEKIESMVGHDNRVYIYASINSNPLRKLNKVFSEAGAKHSFEKYNCHVTLDKYSKEDWKENGAKIKQKLNEINGQLKTKRIYVNFDTIKVANLKD